ILFSFFRLVGCDFTAQSIDTLLSALQTKNSSLKDLDLSNNGKQDLLERFFTGLKNSHCKLETLRLAGCSLTAQSINALQSVLQTEHSSLKHLDLSYNGLRDSLESLAIGLKNSHCRLKTLRLAGCSLTAQCIDTLQSVLHTEHSSLKDLDLSYNGLQDSLESLAIGLKNSHCRLETLRLVGCNLTAQSIDPLQSVLQTEHSSLKDLDLSNNALQDSLESLSAGLKNSHCRIETLRLAGCSLTAQSIATLQSLLQTEKSSLKHLDLSYNGLQASLESLSAGLKNSHCRVEILRLVGCNLSAQSIDPLQSVLQTEHSFLKELDISNNDLDDSGVELLSTGLKSKHCTLEILRSEVKILLKL
ncbi:hypothetical protein NFI96_031796, partial [Prochilodus magdalenae]